MIGNDPPPGGGGNQTLAEQQPQQEPGLVHDSQGLLAPPSYSEKLMANVRKSERYSRNVLEINLECENSQQNLDKKIIADTFAMLGIDIKSQLEGYQVTSKKIFAWCKESVGLDRFCREECIRVTSGITTGFIKPMEQKNVVVTIRGLNLNTPDSLVMEYISKFGQIMNKKVVYDTDKEGPFSGLRNGDRKYLVDFSTGKNMGTFHLIDGVNVTVRYAGQRRTCGRCHQTSVACPGGGWAKTCEEQGGPRVTLREHMRDLWAAIGFKPAEFNLETSEGGEVSEKTVEIKATDQFTPPHRSRTMASQDKDNFIGVTIKNLPKDIPEREVKILLEEQGLSTTQSGIKITRNFKSTKVDIIDLDAELCNSLIANIHEKVFFTKKVYCRGILDIKKADQDDMAHTVEAEPPLPTYSSAAKPTMEEVPSSAQKSSTTTPKNQPKERSSVKAKANAEKKRTPVRNIPGLVVTPKSKKGRKNKKQQLGKSDFLIKTMDGEIHEEEFIFDDHDASEQSSDEENKGFFQKSPLDSTDLNTRSAKITKKEELWNLSVKNAGAPLKRSLELSPEEERRIRTKSLSLN